MLQYDLTWFSVIEMKFWWYLRNRTLSTKLYESWIANSNLWHHMHSTKVTIVLTLPSLVSYWLWHSHSLLLFTPLRVIWSMMAQVMDELISFYLKAHTACSNWSSDWFWACIKRRIQFMQNQRLFLPNRSLLMGNDQSFCIKLLRSLDYYMKWS